MYKWILNKETFKKTFTTNYGSFTEEEWNEWLQSTVKEIQEFKDNLSEELAEYDYEWGLLGDLLNLLYETEIKLGGKK